MRKLKKLFSFTNGFKYYKMKVHDAKSVSRQEEAMNQARTLRLFYPILIFLFSVFLALCFCLSLVHASTDVTADTWFLDDIQAKDAWVALSEQQLDVSIPVIVAVIDTGCDYDHPLIKHALWHNSAEINGVPGVDDDGNGYVDDFYGIDTYHHNSDPLDDSVSTIKGHGTHVAGCILQTAGATESSNPFGIQLMILKAGDAYGNFHAADVAEALRYAADNGASVINLSISALTYPSILEEALEYAAGSAILVASSGNQGLPTCDSKYTSCGNYYPAAYPYITGVMSYGKQHQLSSFSNWDFQSGSEPKYEIAAPGESILSCTYNGANKIMNGTSMSSGIVSGCAALLAAKYQSLGLYSPKNLTAHLMSCGENDIMFTDLYGKNHRFRRINLHKLLTTEPQPNLVLGNYSIKKDDTNAYSLNYKVTNRGCLAKNINITISSDTLNIDSNCGIQELETFPGLSSYNGTCFFSMEEGLDPALPQQIQIEISYQNGANHSDTQIFSCQKEFLVTAEHDPSHTEKVIPLLGITVSASHLLTMKAGSSLQLAVSYIPANTTDDRSLIFHSSNPQIAEIDHNGTIHAKKSGTATITVTSSKQHIRQVSILVYNEATDLVPETPSKPPALSQENNSAQIKKGGTYAIEGFKYKVTNAATNGTGTVTLMKTTQKKASLYSLSVKNTVKIKNARFQITAIDKKAFKNCKNLETVRIADTVKTLGSECFSGCTSLKRLTIGTNISKISDRAFYNCRKLQKITIKSKKLKSIAKNAFRNIHPKVKVYATKRLVKLITRR